MLKIIHTADIHLGSKIDFLSPEKAQRRRAEVLATFLRLVDYAKKEGVKVVMLCGDIFDGLVARRDLEVFQNAIADAPEIDFLYLRGNHDSDTLTLAMPDNFKTFSDHWSSHIYGSIVISGIEPGNSLSFYDELKLDSTKKNIVMLHGQISSSVGRDLVNLKRLQGKGIDYLALGHIHSYKSGELDGGTYAYCGCLEGRGFDELGEKGFVLLEVDERIESKFIPFSRRKLWEIDVDLTGLGGVMPAFQKIATALAEISEEDMVRINLIGEISFDNASLAEIAESRLDKFFFLKVKDMTVPRIDLDSLRDELSLRGEFVRTVLNSEEADDDKMKIIRLGLKALGGEEVEI